MSLMRRDFMKLFGVSVASLLLTRCRGIVGGTPTEEMISCYEAPAATDLPVTPPATITREYLRSCWLQFEELAQTIQSTGDLDDTLGRQMIADHRAALDDLVITGEISAPVADLVQEAYDAAVHHVWRSNVPITCYTPAVVNYLPASADILVKQSEILGQIAGQGTIDSETLAKARKALEQDMAFYTLSNEEVQALHQRLLKESQVSGQPIPSFEELQLELNPDARAAAQFIVDLLTGK